MVNWTIADIPAQHDRSAVVTGTGGLGYETALALTRAGGAVILAGRNPAKGAEAIRRIQAEAPSGQIRFERLDLASLSSVADFAGRLRERQARLDLLVNNAGVMRPSQRLQTEDGLELQFGTNHLGHFALTGELMPLLLKGDAARVVTVSSIAARIGAIDFDDLNARRHYRPMPAYAQSKLACLMFALELQRRSLAFDWGVTSIAAHPGLARTDLIRNAPGPQGLIGPLRRLFRTLFQPAAQGALPTLFAATSPEAQGGGYYGPDRMSEARGHPAPSRIPQQALDEEAAARLWQISEDFAGRPFARIPCAKPALYRVGSPQRA